MILRYRVSKEKWQKTYPKGYKPTEDEILKDFEEESYHDGYVDSQEFDFLGDAIKAFCETKGDYSSISFDDQTASTGERIMEAEFATFYILSEDEEDGELGIEEQCTHIC